MTKTAENSPSVLITGDFCPINRTADLFGENDFQTVFGEIFSILANADLIVTNLECPITDMSAQPVRTGPCLRAEANSIKALDYAGIKLVTLANNHIMDYGVEGLYSTLRTCKKNGINYVGVGADLTEARKPFYCNIKGKSFAFISICENEFSTTFGNTPGANPMEPLTNCSDIRKAKSNTEIVIVIVHGGNEHYPLPSPRRQILFRSYIDCGADLVVGHHSHCYSGYEIYKSKPIFYGLGNFVFDWPGKRNQPWNKGYAVRFTFTDNEIDLELLPYIQNDKEPALRYLSSDEKTEFDRTLENLNSIIQDSELVKREYYEWCITRSKAYMSYFEPYSNSYLVKLYRRGYLPSFLSKKRRETILNLIRCESHREALMNVFSL